MTNNAHAAAHHARDGILKLLTDEEVARVGPAETGMNLSPGEPYLDLEHLEHGVRIARLTGTMSTANVLPKRFVGEDSWLKILAELATSRASAF